MNKKGQIFLAAALILVILIVSFGAVYNSARAPKRDNRITNLAGEIKYEGLRTIDYASTNRKTFAQTETLLNSVIANYSSLNPDLIIFAWFYSPFENRESKFFYEGGSTSTLPASLSVKKSNDLKHVIIKWNETDRNIYYNLSLSNKTYNFNVLVERGGRDEKTVAAE